MKKNHSDGFKFKVALAAVKGEMTVPEMCQKFEVAAGQIYAWKKQLEENGPEIFKDKRKSKKQDEQVDQLYKVLGKVTAERDFLASVLKK